jgi:hypothetical protein
MIRFDSIRPWLGNFVDYVGEPMAGHFLQYAGRLDWPNHHTLSMEWNYNTIPKYASGKSNSYYFDDDGV